QYVGEGDTMVNDPGEMVILPLKFTLTLDRPGTYWAVAEFDGVRLAEVPFTVTPDPPPTAMSPGLVSPWLCGNEPRARITAADTAPPFLSRDRSPRGTRGS